MTCRLRPPRARAIAAIGSVASLSLASLAVTGCGDAAEERKNTPPSVDSFTLTSGPTKGPSGNYDLSASLTVSDPDQDPIPRVTLSGTGPAVVPTASMMIPNSAAGTYPLRIAVAGDAPAGTYTLSVLAYDKPGAASEAKTATFTLPAPTTTPTPPP